MIGRKGDSVNPEQTIEDSSHVLQASRDMSVSNSNNVVNTFNVVNDSAEIERISNIVFQQNYLRLTDDSRAEAIRLAEDFIAIFLDLLSEEGPEKIYAFDSPRMQAATFEAQKAYVETGDRQMARSMAKILLRRATEKPRSAVDVLYQKVAETIPKLATEHLNALAVLVVVYHLCEPDAEDFDAVAASLDKILRPFYGNLPKVAFDYEYMSACGVGVQLLGRSPFDHIRQTNLHLAHHSALPHEISQGIWPKHQSLLRVDPTDDDKFFLSMAAIDKHVDPNNIIYNQRDRNPFEDHLYRFKFDEKEIRLRLNAQNKQLLDTFELLENSSGHLFQMNAVGYTIGLEHVKSEGGNTSLSAEDMWNTPG